MCVCVFLARDLAFCQSNSRSRMLSPGVFVFSVSLSLSLSLSLLDDTTPRLITMNMMHQRRMLRCRMALAQDCIRTGVVAQRNACLTVHTTGERDSSWLPRRIGLTPWSECSLELSRYPCGQLNGSFTALSALRKTVNEPTRCLRSLPAE